MAIVIGLPLIYLYMTEHSVKKKIIYSSLCSFMCSLCNVIRSQNSFCVFSLFIIVIIIDFVKSKKVFIRKIRCYGAVLILFLFFYYLIPTLIPLCIGRVLGLSILNNGAMVWHTLLCGLGFFENPYGLQWKDGIINEIILQKYGYAAYSNRYFYSCRNMFFEILWENPLFVINSFFRKFVICILNSFRCLYSYKAALFGSPQGGLKINIHHLGIPTALSLVFSIMSFVSKHVAIDKGSIKHIISIILAVIFTIIAGTIQGVIGNCYEVRYYVPCCVGIGMLFVVIVIGIVVKNDFINNIQKV